MRDNEIFQDFLRDLDHEQRHTLHLVYTLKRTPSAENRDQVDITNVSLFHFIHMIYSFYIEIKPFYLLILFKISTTYLSMVDLVERLIKLWGICFNYMRTFLNCLMDADEVNINKFCGEALRYRDLKYFLKPVSYVWLMFLTLFVCSPLQI